MAAHDAVGDVVSALTAVIDDVPIVTELQPYPGGTAIVIRLISDSREARSVATRYVRYTLEVGAEEREAPTYDGIRALKEKVDAAILAMDEYALFSHDALWDGPGFVVSFDLLYEE